MDRIYLLNPGQSLDMGGTRTLTAFRPPLFDNPETVGFLDDRTGVSFSSDRFGGPMPSAELAQGDDARSVTADGLRDAQVLWASVDSPWVENVDAQRFRSSWQRPGHRLTRSAAPPLDQPTACIPPCLDDGVGCRAMARRRKSSSRVRAKRG